MEILNDMFYAAARACEDPITKPYAAVLDGVASSITVLPTKNAR